MSSSDFERLRRQLAARVVATTRRETPPPPAPGGFWPDIDYANADSTDWKPAAHLNRTLSLALAAFDRRGPAQPALDALAFWARRDPLSLNWWHNQIGAPRLLSRSLLLLQDSVPAPLLAACRPLLDRADDARIFKDGVFSPVRWTGANLLWISANRLFTGALIEDESLVTRAIAAATSEIRLAGPDEEGIQIDGSFHQHGPLLYNGGYGAAYIGECHFFLGVTRGTHWQAPDSTLRLLADFLLDGTRWMLRGSDVNLSCRDREITRPHSSKSGPADLVSFLAGTGVGRSDELAAFADALRAGRAPGELSGNRLFYRSDFMVQQDARAAFSVRMSSTRTVRAECINDEGLRSHHLADGLTCLCSAGDEYRDIFPVWDWQKLPGTTCVQTPGFAPPWAVVRRGSSALVGGVSDGRHGACAHTLDEETLRARKAWFFGPAGMVCLGAGIGGGSGRPVITTLDQSRLQGPVFHDRSSHPLEHGDHDLHDVRWLVHGTWGFVFPSPAGVSLSLGRKTGAWSLVGTGPSAPVSADVFLASLDHGVAPADAGYAYAVIPATTAGALARLATTPPFLVVANHARCQAVWWPAEQRLQAAFYSPGSVAWNEGLAVHVDRPCCIQLQPASGSAGHTLHVGDLDQSALPVSVTLRSPAGEILARTRIEPPSGIRAGATVTTRL